MPHEPRKFLHDCSLDQFPLEAIAALRSAQWDPNAVKKYEALSGGFWWSDEIPAGALQACAQADSWAYRTLMAYRASLVAGQPREYLAGPWHQIERECPDWPGAFVRSDAVQTCLQSKNRKAAAF
jgi:hypothetical protein